MHTGTKALLTAVALLIAAGVAGWIWRVELLLVGVEVMADLRTPVGPTRQVHWQCGPDAAQAPATERPPNIVLILADDLGWNDLSFNGGGLAGGTVKTPHIDSIAAEGVNFTQGYAANATCAPSRAALLSGRYSTRFGFEFTPTPDSMMPMLRIISEASGRRGPPIIHNEQAVGLPYEDMGMPPSEITLAELLQGRGYHSVHIGKWHLGRSNGMAPEEQGFDESLLMTSGLYGRKDDPNILQSRQDFDPIDLFLWRALKFAAQHNGGPVFEPPRYLTDYYTDEAVRIIEANKTRPFFLYLAHFAPHTPLQATQEDYAALPQVELHRERVYAAMIRALDRSVGRVLDALRQKRPGGEHPGDVHLRQRRGRLPWPGGGQQAVSGLEDVHVRRRRPCALLHQVAGPTAAGHHLRATRASLRPVRFGGGGGRRSLADGPQDGRGGPTALRPAGVGRRTAPSPVLAQRRLAKRAHGALEAEPQRPRGPA